MPQLDPGLPEPLNPGEKITKCRFAKKTGERTPKGAPMEGPHGKAAEGAAADSELLCKAAGG